jgi:uncharacterized membrane protein YdjX (TVP38/TMEM64 family)
LYRAACAKPPRAPVALTRMNRLRLLLLVALMALVVLVLVSDVGRLLSVEALQARYADFAVLVRANFLGSSLAFFLIYATLASLSIPGAALVCTLAGGALFGTIWGSVLVSFASTVGATIACLMARFLLREAVERRFPTAVDKVNEGIRADGAWYLFALRLVPLFPFFIINLVMGLTRLPLPTFYWVSQLGMLPGTVVFVNAGTQLARIEDPGDLLSPQVAGSLALLGLFPLVAKRLSNALLAWHHRQG